MSNTSVQSISQSQFLNTSTKSIDSSSSTASIPKIDDVAYYNLFKKSQQFQAATPSVRIKNVSKLDTFTINWINKRKVNITDRVTGHVLPSITADLKQLFESFDIHGEGEVKIPILQKAVEFMANAHGKVDPLLSDRNLVDKFFQKMDANGDGSIDFGEFLGVMAAETGQSEFARFTKKLHQAFFDYGVYLKRKHAKEQYEYGYVKSSEKVKSPRSSCMGGRDKWSPSSRTSTRSRLNSAISGYENTEVSDHAKLISFRNLFVIPYLPKDLTIVPSAVNTQRMYESAQKEINNYNQRRMRRQEVELTIKAKTILDQKHRQKQLHKNGGSRNHQKQDFENADCNAVLPIVVPSKYESNSDFAPCLSFSKSEDDYSLGSYSSITNFDTNNSKYTSHNTTNEIDLGKSSRTIARRRRKGNPVQKIPDGLKSTVQRRNVRHPQNMYFDPLMISDPLIDYGTDTSSLSSLTGQISLDRSKKLKEIIAKQIMATDLNDQTLQ